jgi:hypothetical protein
MLLRSIKSNASFLFPRIGLFVVLAWMLWFANSVIQNTVAYLRRQVRRGPWRGWCLSGPSWIARQGRIQGGVQGANALRGLRVGASRAAACTAGLRLGLPFGLQLSLPQQRA